MSILKTIVDSLNGWIWSTPEQLPWLVVVLLGAGLFVTLRLGFIQLRQLWHGFEVVSGKYDDPEHDGDISHFAALSTALSATVGIGNIAGVATAIHYGGPGALFWMWVTAVLGMALKFAECTLSMHYRTFDSEGDAAGGPMYYIEKGLGPKWKPLAVLFAFAGIIASFGGGNMNQANTVAVSATTDLGLSATFVGIVAAAIVGAVILGGIRRIASVSSKLAPAMAVLYVASALVILLFLAPEIPGAFGTIVTSAFDPKAGLGGSVAGVWSVTLLWGVKRGLFSNEAGQGSAPIAHAAAKTDEPVREGVVAMLGPLIDTLIICTMTGLVIVCTGVWDEKAPSELPVGHTSVVPAELLPATGESEWARLDAAMASLAGRQAANPSSDDLPAVSLQVSAGQQDQLIFIGRESLIEDALILNADGQPFSGTLRFDPNSGDLDGASGLSIRGAMLQNSSALTAMAFKRGLGPLGDWGDHVVTLCVFLFALSTMISWSYYGDRCVTYLWGAKYVLPYRVIYTGFVFLGSVLALELVWAYGDLALGLMAVPNLLAVVLLTPKLVEITGDYFKRMKAGG